jgi:hypothetical protein
MFAEKFIIILPMAGWLLGIPGNNLLKKGPIAFDRRRIIPPFSPIFIIPNQKDITPVRYKLSSNPVLAISKVELKIAGNTSVS